MAQIRRDNERREDFNFKREQAIVKNNIDTAKMDMERERLNTQKEVADKQLQIARENKNKYDFKAKDSKDKKK